MLPNMPTKFIFVLYSACFIPSVPNRDTNLSKPSLSSLSIIFLKAGGVTHSHQPKDFTNYGLYIFLYSTKILKPYSIIKARF